MAVRLVGEEEEAERARLILHSVDPPPDKELPHQPKPDSPGRLELVEAMGALAKILGFRMQLFAGFLGALALGAYAVYRADVMSLVAAALFYVLVYAPLAYIAFKRG